MRNRPLPPSVLPRLVVLVALAAATAAPGTLPAAQSRDPAPRLPALGDPDDSVVRAAKELIADRLPASPPIYATDPRELKVVLPSNNMPAFRIYHGNWISPVIYVNRFSVTYKQAVGGDRCALKTLAAILVHEMAHSSTKDDKVASRAELETLDAFMRQPAMGMDEQTCLMDRQKAIRRYAGLN